MLNNKPSAMALLAALWCGAAVQAANPPAAPKPPATAKPAPQMLPCTSVTVDAPIHVVLGKSQVIQLATPAIRVMIGSSARGAGHGGKPVEATDKKPGAIVHNAGDSDGIAEIDTLLLSPTELFLSGKKSGSKNLVLQSANGHCVIKDLTVTMDPAPLQAQLNDLIPDETGIKVRGAADTLVLTGMVSDGVKLDQVMTLATAYGDAKRVVNLLRVTAPQQVMLEVKIAEVSKTLLDRLGAGVSANRSTGGGDNVFSLVSNFLSKGGGLFQALRLGKTSVTIDGQKDDGLVRMLAEPNIMAISGQSASFLSGGKIFIPVAQSSATATGSPTITLEEKEFGVGVRFTPTVLDGSRINLKLVSEVSDLSQTGSPFTTVNGVVSILPSLTVRRADTTVQLKDGQSFVIAGLIKNNGSETVQRFPGLGEVPVLGALFRSSEFQKDQTELLFVVTPRLVKPLAEVPTLPTANHVEPSRAERYLSGSLESAAPAPSATPDE